LHRAAHTFAVLMLALALASAGIAAPQPLAGLLARANSLSSSGKFIEAYELLAAAEDEHIGEVEFDYALGRAALDAGRPDRATLAFARVLALDPRHAGALIDTGRAYLALGNLEQARATFDALLALDPPPALRAQLLAYLGETGRAPPDGPSWRGYVAATLGRSTNVNQSPGQAQVFVPAFGASFELARENVAKADRYASLAGGVEASLPIDGTTSLIGGAEFVQRAHLRESAFDLGAVGVRAGVAAVRDRHLVRVQLFAARSELGHDPSRELSALGVEDIVTLSPEAQLAAFAQAGRLRHPPAALRIFDADFATLGLGAARKLGSAATALLGVSAGEERDAGGNPSGNKRLLGLRAGIEADLGPRLRLIAGAAWQDARYDRLGVSGATARLAPGGRGVSAVRAAREPVGARRRYPERAAFQHPPLRVPAHGDVGDAAPGISVM